MIDRRYREADASALVAAVLFAERHVPDSILNNTEFYRPAAAVAAEDDCAQAAERIRVDGCEADRRIGPALHDKVLAFYSDGKNGFRIFAHIRPHVLLQIAHTRPGGLDFFEFDNAAELIRDFRRTVCNLDALAIAGNETGCRHRNKLRVAHPERAALRGDGCR